ncbi:hypothetical protein ABPG75_007918 [Micractinium tetrahymenae]
MQSLTLLRNPSLARPLSAAASRHRAVAAAPARLRMTRAQAEGEESKAVAPAEQSRAVAPQRSTFELMPSFGRMNQMEREMAEMSRAFGMPSLMPTWSSSLFDLPATAADLPAVTAKSLAVDVKDTGKELQIVADVPGMTKDDIKVQVSPDRVLTISGERKSEHKEGSEQEGNLRIERSYGTFMRRFRLPEAVDVEAIKANVKDGVLAVTVPKTEAAQPKQIDVQVSE